MKPTITRNAIIIALSLAVIGCNEKQPVAHDQESDGKPDHGPGAHHDHDHGQKTAGPNGGRIITSVEPHAEFLVTDEYKVRITFLDDHNKAVTVSGQTAGIVCGDRSNPTTLSFAVDADGNSLLSTAALPEGDKYPLILTIKTSSTEAPVREKFTLDLSDCPTCDYREYACTCDHSHHGGHGHGDHDDHDHHDHDH